MIIYKQSTDISVPIYKESFMPCDYLQTIKKPHENFINSFFLHPAPHIDDTRF